MVWACLSSKINGSPFICLKEYNLRSILTNPRYANNALSTTAACSIFNSPSQPRLSLVEDLLPIVICKNKSFFSWQGLPVEQHGDSSKEAHKALSKQ